MYSRRNRTYLLLLAKICLSNPVFLSIFTLLKEKVSWALDSQGLEAENLYVQSVPMA